MKYMENFLLFLRIIGYISSLLSVFIVLAGIIIWAKGILPVLIRIGNGLSKKQIVIFAKNDNLNSLKKLLFDSGLFNKKKISEVSTKGDLSIAENKNVYLVFWHDWEDSIDEILNLMKDKTALIIYAPQELGFIPTEVMGKLNNKRNVMVTNFRGRLLNDITTSIITTS